MKTKKTCYTIEEFKEIISIFPEPFKSALNYGHLSIDYNNNHIGADHEFLKHNGYNISDAHADCCFSVDELKDFIPSSYGDWGSIYIKNHTDFAGNIIPTDEFLMLVEMVKENLVTLWRIRIQFDTTYEYDSHRESKWVKYSKERKIWENCESPL